MHVTGLSSLSEADDQIAPILHPIAPKLHLYCFIRNRCEFYLEIHFYVSFRVTHNNSVIVNVDFELTFLYERYLFVI